jgi:ADP-ribosyl-[dinitrogen reductase] hydrolase
MACPHCGETVRPVPLVFGYPTPETFQAAEAGRVVLGGCIVSSDDPEWACPECGGGLWNVSAPTLAQRLAGAVWGHLVGDAVGVPYEFGPPVDPATVRFGRRGAHDQPPGTWSDDGALMLAMLDSLLERGFDTTDQAQRALAWYRHNRYTPDGDKLFDIGGATRRSLEQTERGAAADNAGAPEDGGNGSLMRILPLALVEREIEEKELVARAHRVSRVTHGHPVAAVCCALYVLVARRLLEGRLSRTLAMGESLITLRRLYESADFEPEMRTGLDFLEAYTDRAGRGRAWDSFWSAWDAFEGADSYDETIRRAVAYGDDTDTTAAIAGGLAGIHWGIDGIPVEWLDGMRGRDIVEPLVDRLVRGAG